MSRAHIRVLLCSPTILSLALGQTSDCLYARPSFVAQDQRYACEIIQKNWYSTTTKASCYYDNLEIGYLYYEKLPFSLYVIHTFFVQPLYRNQGFGTQLLHLACNEIKKNCPRIIIIQPGPFEQTKTEFKAITLNRTKKLQQLVTLYKKAGFRLAPRLLRWLAGYLYSVISLEEDADYLMIQ